MQRVTFGIISRLILTLVLVSLLVVGNVGQASAAAVIYVRWNATGANNGTSWGNAYKSLPTAITKATAGRQIWVAKGTYKPTTTTSRTATFRLKNGVAIYGGFAGWETSLAQRKPAVNVTILSGDIGIAGSSNDNAYHVVTGGGTNSTAVLDGFTIRNGYAINGLLTSQLSGGGMYNVNSSPTLRNLTFTQNRSFNQGGGMYNLNSNPVLTNVTFTSNSGGTIGGGGMYNDKSSPRLTNVKFNTNTAGTDGGGMYNNSFTGPSNPVLNGVTFTGNSAINGGGLDNHGSSPVLTNVTFTNNTASANGGGMFNNAVSNPALNGVTFTGNSATNGGGVYNNDTSEPTFTNVTFSGNTASATGGGMANQSSDPTLLNNTFSGNAATTSGSGLYNADSSPFVYNSIFWADATTEIVDADASSLPTLKDSIVQGATPGVADCLGDALAACTNVLAGDPVLGLLAPNAGTTNTRSLGAGSAAIDAGGLNVACAAKDQRGVSRPQGGKCDIGAYEVKAMQFASQAAYDGQIVESGENTSLGGGAPDTASPTIRIGDDTSNRQVRGFLSFSTANLPDGAAVVLARVRAKRVSSAGSPFVALGSLLIDVRKPYFGSTVALLATDFQAAASAGAAGSLVTPPVLGWYSGVLNAAGRNNINKTGTTQMRLRFALDDNNNHANDYLAIASGNNATVSNRPTLTVYYNP